MNQDLHALLLKLRAFVSNELDVRRASYFDGADYDEIGKPYVAEAEALLAEVDDALAWIVAGLGLLTPDAVRLHFGASDALIAEARRKHHVLDARGLTAPPRQLSREAESESAGCLPLPAPEARKE